MSVYVEIVVKTIAMVLTIINKHSFMVFEMILINARLMYNDVLINYIIHINGIEKSVISASVKVVVGVQ
jgi:hypothetical protein